LQYTLWYIVRDENINLLESKREYDKLNKYRVYIKLLSITYVTWILYPIVFLLYINNIISSENVIIGFIVLDFMSKGVYSFLPIGYELNKIQSQNLAVSITRRVARIVPDIPSTIPEPGEADYTLSQIPNVEDSPIRSQPTEPTSNYIISLPLPSALPRLSTYNTDDYTGPPITNVDLN
jgi:hypothetical protein